MSISSSLNAGVSGLNANAAKLATISDNIANAATYGYKRATADFSSMVINGGTPGSYSAGGVRVNTGRLIDEQGPLVATSNPTDLAITGRGMLPVTSSAAVDSGNQTFPLMLVTTRSFRPDAEGIHKTDTNMVLMGWPAAPDGTIPVFPRDNTAALQPVRVTANQYVGNPTSRISLEVNLPATDTREGASGAARTLTVGYFDNLGTSGSLDVSFTPTVPATGASNEWALTIEDPASGAVVGEYALTFDESAANGGKLLAVDQPPGAPGLAYDPDSGTVRVDLGGQEIEVFVGRLGGGTGLTQLSDNFVPVSVTRNGSPVGNLVTVEVDSRGLVQAVYDTGHTRTIYQIPVIDVPNPNGLGALSNQAYRLQPAAGPYYLWDAGDGPTGEIAGFAREESATDVAAELTQMIQTQRAYSSNAKVIQTVDEMLQETTNIKR